MYMAANNTIFHVYTTLAQSSVRCEKIKIIRLSLCEKHHSMDILVLYRSRFYFLKCPIPRFKVGKLQSGFATTWSKNENTRVRTHRIVFQSVFVPSYE